ncbi:MAG: CHASE2 domain-containing protein [Cytophagales bacterium]
MWLISIIPINKELTEPFAEALADFEITDLGFTVLRAKEPEADTNIVLVNTGRMGNAELAAMINQLNANNPGVIGINEVLHKSDDTFADSLLREALKGTKELVFTAKLQNFNDSTKQWQGIEHSDSIFLNFPHELNSVRYAEVGLENMFTHERDFKTTRHFFSTANYRGEEMKFFASELVEIVAPEKVEKFMQRANEYEIINYIGNYEKFTTLDAYQVLNGEFDPASIKNKIVIMGYMGENLQDEKFWDDYKYYTPLNKNYAGKTFPDMFETVIYANIASQILNDNHIYVVSKNVDLLINIIICILNVIMFSALFHAAAVWWDVFSLVFTLVEIVAFMLGTALVFSRYGIEINLNPSIVFVLLLGQFIELYYGLFKVALQKLSVKYMIASEADKRDKLQKSMKNTTKNAMNDLMNLDLNRPNINTDLNSN